MSATVLRAAHVASTKSERWNDVIQRNKTSFQKTRSAYTRTAIFYAVLGGLGLLEGLIDWRGFGWILTPAGVVFLFAAWVHYSTGRKFERA